MDEGHSFKILFQVFEVCEKFAFARTNRQGPGQGDLILCSISLWRGVFQQQSFKSINDERKENV